MTAGQPLGDLKQQPSDFLSFLYHNKALLIILASGHLLARLTAFLFMRTTYSNTSKRFGCLHQTYERIQTRLPKLAVFFIFLSLFNFINLTLLTNSIKVGQGDVLEIETLLTQLTY